MRRYIQEHDDSGFEILLMRRFHLTPGEPEYVVVKRRLTQDEPDQQRVEGKRSLPKANQLRPTRQNQKRKVTVTESAYKKQDFTARASETVNKKETGKVSGTRRGKQARKAPGHKTGNMRKRNRSAA
jgi:hypothetical protein